MSQRALTTEKAAEAVGITRVTLQRWIVAKKIRAPRTQLVDGRGVRLWNQEDISRLCQVKEELYRKGRGRKPKSK